MKLRSYYIALAAGFLSLPVVLGTLNDNKSATFVNALEKRSGVFEGHRRAHAKGICGLGSFISNGNGAAYTSALFAQPGSESSVTFRFSLGGSNPFAPDSRRAFRSMALMLEQPDGYQWRTAMNHVPVFIIKNPVDFPLLHLAHVADPATGKPDPAKVKAFFDARPETKAMRHWMKNGPLPSSFTTSKFYGVNAFIFENEQGEHTVARWQFVPEEGEDSLSAAQLKTLAADALFKGLRAQFPGPPKRWTLELQLAGKEDDERDPTVKWPDTREIVSLGTLELTSLEEQPGGVCEAINFDPLILPPGILPSGDPVLYARSAAYNISVERRLSEQEISKKPEGVAK